MMKTAIFMFAVIAAASAFTCANPKWSNTGYSTTDGFFHYDTTYITEFSIQCDSGIRGASFFAVINGKVFRVAQSEETSKFQVSWQLPHSESGSQDFDILIYDEDKFAARERAIRNDEPATSIQPLFTITQRHPGLSYPRTYYIETVVILFFFGLLHYAHWCKNQKA
uniref:Translocon-associated protein subunit delta n=1 Tax=Panagrolaimus sp. JU765 TaxID=591449 RepID=A0AC34RAE2_9BILA